ncbi:MAG: DUF1501 domain-containing protein [Flavobacteriales bacterium]|jgi:uncharacterized protein (DUF1501 family)|nr:DUF1501 domain-containing protein [Flavobacteriales bacterium]
MNKKHQLSRRRFIQMSGLAALPITLSGFPLITHARPNRRLFDTDNDRVLILVQLQGGNDGLNTMFDNEQYANLFSVRSNIIVPQSQILPITGTRGFHPGMQGMQEMWQNEKLGIVESVGYPDQNRSHFRSTDIWNSASAADEFITTGWIGRFYDIEYSDYPAGYPNPDNPHPFALTMGNILSETCQGVNTNYSLALTDPFSPGSVLVGAGGDVPANCYGDTLSFVDQVAEQTNAYSAVILEAANAGNNLSPKWESLSSEFSQKLKNIARLLSGGLQTKVFIVQLGGFDTHDNQVVSGATTTGIHAALLQDLSDSIGAFQDDLALLGLEDRVVGMSYSEFGRRVRSNGGLGTDHGTAAPQFLFGACVQNQILGDAPTISTNVSVDEGVPMQFDFRNIYGTVLTQWLGANEAEVQNILFPDFQALPLFKPECVDVSTAIPVAHKGEAFFEVAPNPCDDHAVLTFSGSVDDTRLTLFNAMGGTERILASETFGRGIHSMRIDTRNLAPGTYFVHLGSRGINLTRTLMKR